MEQKILVKHKQAYDTEENWTTNNPILLAGQLAYSSDKYGKYKLGNGTAHWNDLDYCNEKVFTGTRTEYEAANSNGEIKPGTIVNITDDNDYQGIDIDTELSEESENLVTNKAVTTGIKYNDTKDNTTTFLSDDTLEPEGYSDISLLKSSETHSSIFNKLSTMFKNVRYLFGMLGTTDISSIGDGTVTDAISRINTGLVQRTNTKEANKEKSLANLKETGIYAVKDADDMPNGKSSAVLETNNFSSQNGNYCIQRIVYIEDYKKIYQRRIHQEEGAGAWEEFVSISIFSDALPYIFSYFTSQPFFVISESSQDTMYCNGRGCRRNSSAKALIFKRGGRLKDVSSTSGYGIISYTNSDVSCTELTNYGGISINQRRTPKGNIVSIGIMGAAWVNTGGTVSFPVIATINGKTHELTNPILYAGDPESYLVILCMADFYLF